MPQDNATMRPSGPADAHVLVCLDRSPLGESVLPHALTLARSVGARITFLHVFEPDHHTEATPTDPLAWEIRSAEGRHYVEALAARHRASRSSGVSGPIRVNSGTGMTCARINSAACVLAIRVARGSTLSARAEPSTGTKMRVYES
jgi:hypothetical protein